MKYLGLDLGTKTLGVSISDLTHTIATTYKTLRYDGTLESLLIDLKKIINDEQIELIVLGLPKNMNNTIGESALKCLSFKTMIEDNLNVKVEMQDERLTTVEATNYMIEANMSRKKRKQKIDSLAANIILQTYLDRKKD